MKKIFIVITLLTLSQVFKINNALGQSNCGTTISKEKAALVEDLLKSNKRSSLQNVAVEIPIKFHSVRRNDGSGGLSETEKDNLIDQINAFYANSSISFFHEGDINYIDNDDAYNLDSSSEGLVTSGNTVPKTINVYFTGSLSSNGNPVCGYTRFPPSADHIFVVYGCVLNGNSTLEHELGHYFTLYHTHGTTNTGTTDELVDGSNCQSAGDRLCDTPADPNLSGVVNNDCVYIGTARDANDQTYNPDVSNIMSYSIDRCQDKFSPQQYQRIRAGFENGRGYLNYRTENFIATMSLSQNETCINTDVDFTGNSFGANEWYWEFEGGTPSTSSSQNPTVYYENSGVFDVSLTVTSNAGESFTLTRNNVVRVINPLDNSTQESIDFDDNAPINFNEYFEVVNPDLSLTYELVNVTLDGQVVELIKMDNFNYVSETPGISDFLQTVYLDNTGVSSYQIDVEYAYTFKEGGLIGDVIFNPVYDSLNILLENQCGNTPIILDKIGGEELSTVPPSSEEFVPNSLDDFSSFSFNYEVGEDESFARIIFENISFNGNNFYIKDIAITQDYSVEAPSNFRFVRVESDSLLFRWVDNSNNELGFVLETSLDGEVFENFYDIESGMQEYKVALNNLNQSKFFRIKAIGLNDNESEYTSIVEISNAVLSTQSVMGSRMTVYPNPVTSSLIIDSEVSDFQGSYKIISMQGQTLMEGPVTVGSQVNLSTIGPGIIFVKIFNEKNQTLITKKLIKL